MRGRQNTEIGSSGSKTPQLITQRRTSAATPPPKAAPLIPSAPVSALHYGILCLRLRVYGQEAVLQFGKGLELADSLSLAVKSVRHSRRSFIFPGA
ncbi:hypothetical protein ACFX2B_022295 [Malus domestica]